MSEFDDTVARFKQAEELLERLIEALPKARLAEVTRLLAMNVAHYKQLHGEIPLAETLRLARYGEDDASVDAEALRLAAEGLEELAGLIGLLLDDPDRTEVH